MGVYDQKTRTELAVIPTPTGLAEADYKPHDATDFKKGGFASWIALDKTNSYMAQRRQNSTTKNLEGKYFTEICWEIDSIISGKQINLPRRPFHMFPPFQIRGEVGDFGPYRQIFFERLFGSG